MQLRGVYTALVTPFSDAGERVDLDAYRALARRQLSAGVHGLVPCGTTGETPTLSTDEWADCVRIAVEVAAEARAADGIARPVIAGCGTNATTSTVHNVAAAAELGADAALVVFPYYNKPNPIGHRAHVAAACAPGLPVVLYHVPGRTGQRLPASQLAELCACPGVIALKEATGDVGFGLDVLELTESRTPPTAILSGDDFTFAPLVAMGGHGVISVVSNVAPALTVAWYDAARDGDVATLQRLRKRLQPVVRWLFADTNPAPAKAALAAMGLCQATPRLPLAAAAPPPPGLITDLT